MDLDTSLDGKATLVAGAGPDIRGGITLVLARYGAKAAFNKLTLEIARPAVCRIELTAATGLAPTGYSSVENVKVSNTNDVIDMLGKINISAVNILPRFFRQGSAEFIAIPRRRASRPPLFGLLATNLAPRHSGQRSPPAAPPGQTRTASRMEEPWLPATSS